MPRGGVDGVLLSAAQVLDVVGERLEAGAPHAELMVAAREAAGSYLEQRKQPGSVTPPRVSFDRITRIDHGMLKWKRMTTDTKRVGLVRYRFERDGYGVDLVVSVEAEQQQSLTDLFRAALPAIDEAFAKKQRHVVLDARAREILDELVTTPDRSQLVPEPEAVAA